ncbi:2-oxoacid:ferredoxin oxidoreductase subunit beta [Pseudonocardia sp. KRD-184]|uniref:2-oxoacid:ferredoxin oxidoreductase subunit beta n=1 Tax=Pseudonocardia oceani TaxID=2792013 RepID=A0ABS6U7Z1_9PSEU|nr:2-oxoacid:ferredoxin oxidoreductase subunit beta [Pseudonocardia oceani]MBW0089847.1 2-oxoacid:ferredoxin oxidoreductase subunit beta [Pseudonocardia oceani]MBW0096949.1 2-oxoacid:ferredoxin oxidoreductase subunit beta [Pseudonocardia oceani]MBW0108938.1 2-oxoacid:ferredoxin oxidoreductase subunit beta [Pseudonocardia oceani]MBW0120870.1 2-oxoacid:ferredoxin oxidoreductase subunit beta [Pseudonocardia oceani]MBW0128081.1 2-oxoacid:ferredoxin oxidoreductase subunit beta [Pseudonocardia ocean
MTALDLGLPSIGGLDGVPTTTDKQTAKDFTSDQEVRWCPGCGDYAVLAAVRQFLPTLGIKRENTVFISGIGCSSRFPYYLNTYGMHSIHGRAPTIATGLAVSRPDLSVWVVTGDGDALSIGGNHLIHALRRNVNLKILLFNNRIYGLTKGQYSPTSEVGKVTKSTPMGSVDHPFNPVSLALGAEATFVGRAIDSDRKGLTAVLGAAAAHRGTALVEIFQDCPIFNDGSFDVLRKGDDVEERLIHLTDGEPIRFGPAGDDGLGTFAVVREGFGLGVAKAAEVDASEIVVHDARDHNLAFALSRLSDQDLTHTVTGIFRDVDRTTYDDATRAQVDQAREAAAAKGGPDLQALLHGRDTWTVVG